MGPLTLLALALLAPVLVCAAVVPVDFNGVGPVFQGIGGLSGGGGTSRLLYDYPEPQRSDILDALFSPQGGAHLHILKVEIGGDTQSTEATEASHMHTREDLNFERGYEWWLMQEAKKRNPNISLFGLSWGVPGWIGNGSYFSQDNIDYHIKWLQGAKQVYNLTIDYLGLWNERNYDNAWTIRLRQALDAAQFGHVQIVAADDGGWGICDSLVADPAFAAAVSVVGSHYPITSPQDTKVPPPSCAKLNKPLWTSEGWNLGLVADWEGASNLAWTINTNYVRGNMTAMVVWTVIFSWYAFLPFSHPVPGSIGGAGHGLMYATEPWSGHYSFQPAMFAVAHTTQFSQPGCHYLFPSATGSNGFLDDTQLSSLVVFLCNQGQSSPYFSIVIETIHETAAKSVTLSLSHLPAPLSSTTFLYPFVTNSTQSLVSLSPLSLSSGSASLLLLPNSVYTLTSLRGGQSPPQPQNPNPPSVPFPLPYRDTFNAYRDQATVRYFTDQGGSFNAAMRPDGSSMAFQQVVTLRPIEWEPNPNPFTIMGDAVSWADYSVSIDALIVPPSGPSPVVHALQAVVDKCDGSVAQQWLWDAGTGSIFLASNTSMCLGLYGALPVYSEDPDVAVLPCGSGYPVQWRYDSARQVFQPTSRMDLCLDILASTTTPGTPVFAYPCNYNINEQWIVSGSAIVSKLAPGVCLAASNKAMNTTPVYTQVCARISTYTRGGAAPEGYCLQLFLDGSWKLSKGATTMTQGTVSQGSGWHTLGVGVQNTLVAAVVDGVVVAEAEDTQYKGGMIAVGSGWHQAYFDNLAIYPL